MLSQGQVGPISNAADGVQVAFRQGKLGEQIMSELHGRYYESCYRRAQFNAANQAGQVTTVGLATTYTGLVLSNPIGSGINLVLEKVGVAFPVAVAAGLVYGLMVGYNSGTAVTHTTPSTTLRSNFVGVGAAPVGLVDTVATLPTAPTVSHVFGAIGTAAITAPMTLPTCFYDLEGSVILPPGAYAAIYTSAASGAAGMFGSFTWEEVPA
jgi:hypothetical protein